MDRGPHSKRRAYELGQHLADLVSAADLPASLADGARYLAEDHLPPEIGRGRILASVDGEDELWDAGGGGWVQKVTETHIRNVVAAKDRTLDRIRTRCDVAWLVIAHDLFREGSPSELAATEVDANYPTGFDRLLWLEVAVPSVRELRRIEPAGA